MVTIDKGISISMNVMQCNSLKSMVLIACDFCICSSVHISIKCYRSWTFLQQSEQNLQSSNYNCESHQKKMFLKLCSPVVVKDYCTLASNLC